MLTRLPLRCVFFDWDGTLLDSFQADAAAYLRTFEALGIAWGVEQLAPHYSPDWRRVYRAAGLPIACWPEADRLWRMFYRAERPKLQAGARGVIEELAGVYVLGLVTSGSHLRVRRQLHAFGFDRVFPVQVFGDQLPRRKPHPAQLQWAMRRMGAEPAACVYVGDAPEDVEMARRAGVAAVGVLGQSPVPAKLRLSHPSVMISTIAQLPGLLLRG